MQCSLTPEQRAQICLALSAGLFVYKLYSIYRQSQMEAMHVETPTAQFNVLSCVINFVVVYLCSFYLFSYLFNCYDCDNDCDSNNDDNKNKNADHSKCECVPVQVEIIACELPSHVKCEQMQKQECKCSQGCKCSCAPSCVCSSSTVNNEPVESSAEFACNNNDAPEAPEEIPHTQ